jgi:hypothetical protein
VAIPSQRPGAKGSPALPLDARARDDADRRDKHRNEQLADTCGDIEESLELLRSRYDLYFLGIERREPARERDELKRSVARLKGEFTRNTGLRFRIETLHARFLSYERMWTRNSRQKEDGTYRRDLLRARRHRPADLPAGQEARAVDPATSARAAPAATAAAASPASPPPVARAAPETTPVPIPLPAGMGADQLRELYTAYVDAKKRCNEDVSRVSYEALAKTVARQVPELMSKFRARSIEFKVVIKDGRAVLKAVPRM